MRYGLVELPDEEILDLYERQLTNTERSYYDAWRYWHLFKKTLPPWKYFNTKKIKWDHILMIEQFEMMRKQRLVERRKQEELKQNNRAMFPTRDKTFDSVL